MTRNPLVLAALALAGGQSLAQTTYVGVAVEAQSLNSTSALPQTLSLSGSGLDGLGSGDAMAIANFGGLGVSADGTAVPAEAFPTVGASAEARFTDTLFVSGTPGSVASLSFAISLAGSCFTTDGATDGHPDAACAAAGSLGGPPSLSLGVSNDRTSSATVITWAEGTVLPIGAYLTAGGYAWNGLFDASFADTLHVYAWSETPGVVLTSASGHDYSPVSAVPEPGDALLLASGLLMLAHRSRAARPRGR